MQQNEALAGIADHPGWYHTIDLGNGVSTPGFVDLRPFLKRSLPRDLTGKRCLDVGTFDGFWAFAMEDRGAQSVVAIDVDDTSQLEHPPLRREANIAAARASGVSGAMRPWIRFWIEPRSMISPRACALAASMSMRASSLSASPNTCKPCGINSRSIS